MATDPAACLAPVLDATPSRALPTRHRCVLLLLTCFTGNPTTAALAARAGCSRSRLCRMLRELDAAGWIVRTPTARPGGGQGPTHYTVRPGGPIVPTRTKSWPVAA